MTPSRTLEACLLNNLIPNLARVCTGTIYILMQALKQHKWTSPTPLTRSRLEKERDEFWDTSPNYGGKPEVWQVLKAACAEPDHSLVQAILDAGRITVPSNRAAEFTAGESAGSGRARYDPMAQFTCFDHLGNMYVVPVKCLSAPSNLVEDEVDGATHIKSPTQSTSKGLESNVGSTSSKSTGQSSKKDKERAKSNRVDALDPALSSSSSEATETVRLRVSTAQKETLLKVPRSVSVGQIKELLFLDPATQLVRGSRIRIFFLGRILEDKERLQDVSHFELGPQGTVLQVQASP
ncbi:Ubiquitin domain-containing protein 2 [Podila verticillata]|nr:Ubiquitin domain-containing protein 2 [Podila verticillata]